MDMDGILLLIRNIWTIINSIGMGNISNDMVKINRLF